MHASPWGRVVKPGEGASFVDLDDGQLGPTISVTKLEEGYVLLTIVVDDRDDDVCIRVTVSDKVADLIGAALRAAGGGS